MSRLRLSSLVFALLAGFSLAAHAAPTEPPAPAPAPAPATAPQVQVAQVTKVSLNSADAETLARELSGVGAAKAQAIVAYRDSQGPFAAVDELLEVKGIGPAILEKNRDRLSVD